MGLSSRRRLPPGRSRTSAQPYPARKTARTTHMNPVMVLEIGGSLLVLAAFAASQLRRLTADSVPYLTLNLVGSAVLAGVALSHRSWGFLLLEGTWAVLSAAALGVRVVGTSRAGRPARAGGGRTPPAP